MPFGSRRASAGAPAAASVHEQQDATAVPAVPVAVEQLDDLPTDPAAGQHTEAFCNGQQLQDAAAASDAAQAAAGIGKL